MDTVKIIAIIMAVMLPALAWGQALMFSKSPAGYATWNSSAENTLPHDGFSAVVWMKLTTNPVTTDDYVFWLGGAYNAGKTFLPMWIKPSGGITIKASRNNDTTYDYIDDSNTKLSSNKLYCVVAVRTNRTWSLYINGVKDTKASVSSGGTYPNPDTGGGWIGVNYQGQSNLKGTIYDLRIYDCALTVKEVSAISNAYPYGSDGIIRNLAGWWTGAIWQAGIIPTNTTFNDLSGCKGIGTVRGIVVSDSSVIGKRGGIIK